MQDLMFDIETLGTGTRGLITQIGACYFDRYNGKIGDTFCENIRIQDSLNNGFEVMGDTIEWWLNQDKEIIKKMLENPKEVRKVLEHFKQFYKKGTIAWSHATFDFPILTNAYHLLKIKPPIPYKKMRDIRTLIDLSGLKREKETKYKKCPECFKGEYKGVIYTCNRCKGTGKIKTKIDPKNHNALDDCIYQVGYCVEAFKKLRINK